MNHNLNLNTIALICNVYYRNKVRTDAEGPQYWLSPFAGFLPGVIIAVLCGTFVFTMGSVGGGILTAILAPLFLEILTGWRGLEVTVAVCDRLIGGETFSEILNPADRKLSDGMQPKILFASIYLLRMAAFGLIASSGNAVWFLFVLGGAYLIRGEILAEEEFDPEAPQYGNWIIYVVGCLLAGMLTFHWMALAALPAAILLTILLLWGIRRILNAFSAKTEFWQMELFGYFAENLLLLAGLILFGRTLHG